MLKEAILHWFCIELQRICCGEDPIQIWCNLPMPFDEKSAAPYLCHITYFFMSNYRICLVITPNWKENNGDTFLWYNSSNFTCSQRIPNKQLNRPNLCQESSFFHIISTENFILKCHYWLFVTWQFQRSVIKNS